jgi:beta-xylosidase
MHNEKINRFRPGEIWPDTDGVHINAHGGGVTFHDGVYYWFGEHKVAGEIGNTAQVGVGCYSSTDLHRWTNRGIALAVSDDPQSPIVRGCVLERPKVIFNAATGLFVMWFHLERPGSNYGDAMSGVAISERITGPYRFIHANRVNAGVWPMNVPPSDRRPLDAAERAVLSDVDLQGGTTPAYPRDLIFRRDFAGGQMARDMTLFVDDDSAAYHLYASEENGVLHISQLSDDYQRPAGKYIRIFPGGFHEAPAIFKHARKYWLITSGCTGWFPNAARLAVAPSIWGPWEAIGNPCTGERSEITFDGQGTFILPVQNRTDTFIFMADRWRPENAIDGRYLWLPIRFADGQPVIEWADEWGFE